MFTVQSTSVYTIYIVVQALDDYDDTGYPLHLIELLAKLYAGNSSLRSK